MATLLHYLKGEAENRIPVWRMLSAPLDEIERRAQRWVAVVGNIATVERGESMVGGGSLPGSTLPTHLLAIRERARGRERKALPELARRLRAGDPNVLCRIEKDRLLLDPRTVLSEEEEFLLDRLRSEIAKVFPAA